MATGVRHRYNFLKFRILTALFEAYPDALTTRDIVDQLGVPQNHVSRILSNWIDRQYKYVRRLKKKDGRFINTRSTKPV